MCSIVTLLGIHCGPIVYSVVSTIRTLLFRTICGLRTLDGDVGRCQLNVLLQALLNSLNVAVRRQRTIPSLLNVSSDNQREVGDHSIHAEVDQVLDQVEPVGCPGLDLQAVSMSGIDHGLVGECDESGKGRVIYG